MGKLDEARAKSLSLSKLLSEVNGTYKETSPLLDLRNKAYVHLKEAMGEIRQAGQSIFRNNKKKLEEYTSPYIRRMHEARKKKTDKIELSEGKINEKHLK